MNFTWFGLGLLISFVLPLFSTCHILSCSLSRKNARRKVKEMNERLKDAKSSIVEICPMELWCSGEA